MITIACILEPVNSTLLTDIKNLCEIGAILAAGLWAVYGFRVLKRREKERAELQVIELEIQKSEQTLRQFAVLNTKIFVKKKLSAKPQGTFLFITVKISNQGKRETQIKWKGNDPAFSVRRVVFNNKGVATFPDEPIELNVLEAKDPNVKAVSNIIRTGGSHSLSFALFIKDPGVYLLAFRGTLAPDERAVGIAAGANEDNPLSWTATKYVHLEKF